jgi:hypothetical protein
MHHASTMPFHQFDPVGVLFAVLAVLAYGGLRHR